MRDAFIHELNLAAACDKDIHLITGDLGFGVLTQYEKDFPNQYTNAGVAEQNMTGLAAGLAMNGFKVFTYSIGNFSTLRCLEQIRNDICYHDLNVTIVSVGGGFSYGGLGFSHHATEDFSILRSLPGLSVYAPSCIWEAKELTKNLLGKLGPKYLRLDKSGMLSTRMDGETFSFEKVRDVSSGNLGIGSSADILLVASGGILEEALIAAENLREKRLKVRVLSVHSLKPFDVDGFLKRAENSKGVFSIEENVVEGGLGSLLSESLLESGVRPKFFKRFGIHSDSHTSVVGDQKYLRSQHRLLGEQITKSILDIMGVNRIHEKLAVLPVFEART